MSVQTTALLLAWVAIALLGLALAGLLRQVHLLSRGRVQPRFRAGPEVGSIAPELAPGDRWARRAVLLFAERGCNPCDRILPLFQELAARRSDIDFKLLFRGPGNGVVNAHVEVLTDQDQAFQGFGIPATPYGVIIDERGTVMAAAPVGSHARLQQLLERVDQAGVDA